MIFIFSLAVYMMFVCPILMLRLSGGSFPKPLSTKEEELFLQRSINGDIEARNVLIERNLRLVAHVIKKYYTNSEEQDDLISIGTVGLIKGIASYKPDKGVKLATYASRRIENELLMYFRSRKKFAGDVSLSDTLDSDEGDGLTLLDTLSADDDMFESLCNAELCKKLKENIKNTLDLREEQIISLRYGLYGNKPLTQRETAERLFISRSYV